MRDVIELRYDVEYSTSAFSFESSTALDLSETDTTFNRALVELIHLGTAWIERNDVDYSAIDEMADTKGNPEC
jgi:hypothetical protein